MKKISLNLNQETPMTLRHGLVRNSEFSQRMGSPSQKQPTKHMPKLSFQSSKDFSGLSPIKPAYRERESDSSRSSFPLNVINFNQNSSRNDNLQNESQGVFKTDRPEKNFNNRYSLNPNSLRSTYETATVPDRNKENYEPNKFLSFQKNFLQTSNKKPHEEQKDVFFDVPEKAITKHSIPKNLVTSKLTSENNNICEYVEDFENSYNLQIEMLQREYKNQYFVLFFFLVFWVYLMHSVGNGVAHLFAEKLENNYEEENYYWIVWGYCKFIILLTLIIYCRVSSFESL